MLPADGPVRTVTTVLDEGGGPVMCLGMVMQSSPPQCDGPDVAGWEWADHPEADAAGGVRWGGFVVVGDWDGTTLTVTAARPATDDDWPRTQDDDFVTSCDEPDGGWVVVDPATTTNGAKGDANRVAEQLPDYGLIWADQSINPRWPDWQRLVDGDLERDTLELEQAMNDPRYTILNVGVTDDLARAEAAVREVWGGPLCVYELYNTSARLREVADELRDLPGNLTPQFGTISNRVDLPVIHDDGSIQAWVDEEYGEDVVEVTSALTPVG
ncbi:hypothetical protein GCM10009797_33480 [Nocardioides hwasunensis]